jgi:uncharacterized protein YndB with AHSA1/START domain
MTETTAMSKGDRAIVRLERRLVESPGSVWAMLTDREELRRWFPCDVVVEGGEWIVGRSIRFMFPPEVMDLTMSGEVLEVEVGRRLSYTWGDEVLTMEIRPDGLGCVLVLIDELDRAHAARNSAGWEDCLDRLEGRPVDPTSWRPRFEAFAARYSPDLGAQEGPPVDYKGDL